LPPSGVAPRASCTALTGLTLPNTQILSATQKSGYCNVVGIINKRVSTQDPDHFTYGIGFALNLPNTWHGRFEMMGGGGTDGSLNADPQGAAGVEVGQGWAVAVDDGGHEDNAPNPLGTYQDDDANAGGSAHFAIDAQARRDYGYNGIEKTATTAKQIISYFYGLDTVYSYIMGCSNGGRDAMVASQRSPWLFDGVISQNPGFNLPQAGLAEAWNEQVLGTLSTSKDVNGQPFIPDTFPQQDLQVASAAILSACDALDGLVDGIIDNYHACTAKKVYPALASYTCGTGSHGSTPHGGTCLTSAQVGALKKIYSGPVNSRGERLYSNWFWDAGIWTPPSAAFVLGWQAWNVVTAPVPHVNTAINLTLGAGAIPMIFQTPPVVTPVNGPNGQEAFVFKFNFDTDAPKIFTKTAAYPESSMDFMAAVATNLHPFKARGGKLIISSSVNDGIFSGASIARWYRKMNRNMGDRATDFARLFMVPNMAHCGGGAATDNFAGNELKAITDWVENGIAPERIVAANTNTASPYPPGGLFDPRVAQNFPTGGTRPLCVYPKIARYKGQGLTSDAANFACVDPGFIRGGDHDFDDDDDGHDGH
jgi:feruloyl esterase